MPDNVSATTFRMANPTTAMTMPELEGAADRKAQNEHDRGDQRDKEEDGGENLLQQLRHTLPRLGHESSADQPRAPQGGGEIAEAARRQTDHVEVKIQPERRHGPLVRGVGVEARRAKGPRPEHAKQPATART